MYEEIRDFLSENDYIVTVQQTKDGCRLTAPKREIEPSQDYLERDYSIKYGRNSGVQLTEGFVKCPAYAARAAVWCDIMLQCELREYDKRLIRLLNIDGNDISDTKEVFDILPPSKNKSVLKKEDSLTEIFVDSMQNGFNLHYDEQAKLLGVEEGYHFILQVLARR